MERIDRAVGHRVDAVGGRPRPLPEYIRHERVRDDRVELYKRRGGHALRGTSFVGTMGDVADRAGAELAVAFYAELMTGSTVAEALLRARVRTARATLDAGMFYTAYGYPEFRLIEPRAAPQRARPSRGCSDARRLAPAGPAAEARDRRSAEGAGLVVSLARPGGNITGDHRQHARPRGKAARAADAADRLGVKVRGVEVRRGEDLDGALAAVSPVRPDALLT